MIFADMRKACRGDLGSTAAPAGGTARHWLKQPSRGLCIRSVDGIFPSCYIPSTAWEAAQIDVDAVVLLLETQGPFLSFPYSSGVSGSRHSHMRELRVQHKGRPMRILYAFDPHRTAILLLGGDKTGNDRWYEMALPRADRLYDEHLRTIGREGGD
jgi:hypothetical protein